MFQIPRQRLVSTKVTSVQLEVVALVVVVRVVVRVLVMAWRLPTPAK